MKPPRTFTEMVAYAMSGKRAEPVKRVKCLEHVPRGCRQAPERPRNVIHRFEIVGGVSMTRLLTESVTAHNTLTRFMISKLETR